MALSISTSIFITELLSVLQERITLLIQEMSKKKKKMDGQSQFSFTEDLTV